MLPNTATTGQIFKAVGQFVVLIIVNITQHRELLSHSNYRMQQRNNYHHLSLLSEDELNKNSLLTNTAW